MKNFILLISFIVCVSIVSDAQTSYEDFKKKSRQDIESFRDISKKNYAIKFKNFIYKYVISTNKLIQISRNNHL